ncbi:MAG: tetratricopeptide repeat protein [Chloroflexi bacterium]|nr:tetratricopeptide repeat protein [Chloroflexota bacterium]
MKRAHALLALLLLGTLACSTPASLAYRLNEQGNGAYYARRYDQALEWYRQAQVTAPDHPELNINAGSALHQQGEFERAGREVRRALSAPDARLRARAHFTLGNNFFRMGQLPEALEEYKWALRLDPTDQDAKYNLEYVLRQLSSDGTQQPGGQPGQPGDQGQEEPANQEGQVGQAGQEGQVGPSQPNGGLPQGGPDSDALDRMLQEAGADLSIEQAMRILDALRERERAIQAQIHRGGGNVPPGDRDW